MEEKAPRSHLKRPFQEDDDSSKPPVQKRVRFPKGKKIKPGNEVVLDRGKVEECTGEVLDARLAAKECAKRRDQITAELFSEDIRDVSAAEVEDSKNSVLDGIEIEPFNLNKEREEGYFDADGNFVEYVNDNEIKDAWLDSVEAEPKYAGKVPLIADEVQDLSSEDIGKMKRRIADILEPGETALQALRRLRGISNNRKEKMSAETKVIFDQLTEDAMKLMENGEYNVYHEKQEVFQREAEGYERLAQARGKGTSISAGNLNVASTGKDLGVASSVLPDTVPAEVSNGGADDEFDMFAEDDEPAATKPSFDNNNLDSGHNTGSVDVANADPENGALQNDYVYDESSGYYYSSSSGYYYDQSTGLYCSAASGQWFSYNEEAGTWDEFHAVAPTGN